MARPAPRLSNDELLSKVIDKLDVISKVVAFTLIQGVASRQDQIELLDVAGFRIREIADLLAISPKTVASTLSTLRKYSRNPRIIPRPHRK